MPKSWPRSVLGAPENQFALVFALYERNQPNHPILDHLVILSSSDEKNCIFGGWTHCSEADLTSSSFYAPNDLFSRILVSKREQRSLISFLSTTKVFVPSPYSSFPHGGWALFALMVSCITALSATMYGMASCRFLYVDFQSDRGDFSQFYLDSNLEGEVVKYRAGIGIFSWLLPSDANDWSKGTCLGYTEVQKETFGDGIFEASRVFGLLSVLGGIIITSCCFFLTCISLTKLQIWLMNAVLFLLAWFVGLTFIVFQSQLCQDLMDFNDNSQTSECSIDRGGLATIAACLFWCVALVVSIFCIKATEQLNMTVLPDRQIVSTGFEERQQQENRPEQPKSPTAQHEPFSGLAKRWPRFGLRGQDSVQPSSPPPLIEFNGSGDGVEEVELHLPPQT
jgi:hypothetical protein